MTPEALIRSSVQWRVYDEVASADEVSEALAYVATETARRTSEAALAKAKFEAEVKALRDDPQWAHLNQENPNGMSSGTFVATNLRKGLKMLFPGIKFSIRSDHDTARVGWEDGPAVYEVELFTKRFRDSYFDSMQDITCSNRSPWNVAFGGCTYVNSSHICSDAALLDCLELLFAKSCLVGNLKSVERPSLAALKRNGTEIISGVNITISEAVWAIAGARDGTTGIVRCEAYNSYAWLLESLT